MSSKNEMDWTGCEVVEVVSGKVSGLPILKESRVKADVAIENAEYGFRRRIRFLGGG